MHIKNFIPLLILDILEFYEFCNLIGQEYTQMCLIIFNWNIWDNLIFLWILIKRHLKLIYYLEVLWVYPAVPDQVQLIISMDFYSLKISNFMLELFHEILNLQESCNLTGQENLWQQNKTSELCLTW